MSTFNENSEVKTRGSWIEGALKQRVNEDSIKPDMIGENGDLCYSSLGSDFLSKLLEFKQEFIGNEYDSIINQVKTKRFYDILNSAKESDSERILLWKFLFFTRAIRCQGNRSRNQFYILLTQFRNYFPEEALKVIKLIPHYGYYKDIDNLIESDIYLKNDTEMVSALLDVYANSIFKDLSVLLDVKSILNLSDYKEGINELHVKLCSMEDDMIRDFVKPYIGKLSLAAKYLSREGKKSYRNQFLKKMVPNVDLSNKKSVSFAQMILRKAVSLLSQCNLVVEQKMCYGFEKRDWRHINPKDAGSVLVTKNRLSFLNIAEDGKVRSEKEDRIICGENFSKAIIEGTLNGSQCDFQSLVNIIWSHVTGFKRLQPIEMNLVEVQWKKMVSFVSDLIDKESNDSNSRNVLAVVDVSGSMKNYNVIQYSIGLGILCGSISNIKEVGITFHTTPSVFQFDRSNDIFTLFELVLSQEWGGSTNLDLTFRLVLDEMIKARNKNEEIGTDFSLLIFSDEQFDSMVKYDGTLDTFQKRWEEEFFRNNFNVPLIKYWNLRSTDSFVAKSDMVGVKLLSGFSQTIMIEAMTGNYQDVKDDSGHVKVNVTPTESFLETLNHESFDLVEKALLG